MGLCLVGWGQQEARPGRWEVGPKVGLPGCCRLGVFAPREVGRGQHRCWQVFLAASWRREEGGQGWGTVRRP